MWPELLLSEFPLTLRSTLLGPTSLPFQFSTIIFSYYDWLRCQSGWMGLCVCVASFHLNYDQFPSSDSIIIIAVAFARTLSAAALNAKRLGGEWVKDGWWNSCYELISRIVWGRNRARNMARVIMTAAAVVDGNVKRQAFG